MSFTTVQRKTGTAAAASLTITLDATPTDGNLLEATLYAAAVSDATLLTMTQAGWLVADRVGATTGATSAIAKFYKIASGDIAAQQLNATGSTSIQGEIAEYSTPNGWQASPLDKHGTNLTGSSATSIAIPAAPTAATAQADELATAAFGTAGANGGGVAWSDSFTARSTSINARLSTADKTLVATGAQQTTPTWTTGRATRGVLATYMPVVPVNHTRTITDVEGLTDSRTVVAVYARSQTDADGLTDAQTHPVTYVRSATDAEGLTDAQTGAAGYTRSQADALGLTDTALTIAAYLRSLTDAEGITDAMTYVVTSPILVTITDALGLTDGISVLAARLVILTDLLALTDRVRWLQTVNRAAGCAVETPTGRSASVAAPTTRDCPAPSVGPYGNRRV